MRQGLRVVTLMGKVCELSNLALEQPVGRLNYFQPDPSACIVLGCRYGVGDSVGLAVQLDNRYRGIRSPHKFKGGVSGCVRECAEAQSKDFGIIATDKGWNSGSDLCSSLTVSFSLTLTYQYLSVVTEALIRYVSIKVLPSDSLLTFA